MAKQNITLVTSPVGTLNYPHLISPDMQENMPANQRKEGGVYNTDFHLDTNDTEQAAFIDSLNKLEQENFDKVLNATPKAKQASLNRRPIFSIVYDSNDEDTGYVTCKMKLEAQVRPKNHEGWDQKVKLFDKDGNFFEGDNIGNGTKARVKIEIRPYGNASIGIGVSLRLHQLQIMELVEYVPEDSGDSFGSGKAAPKAEVKADSFANATAKSQSATASDNSGNF